MTIKIHNGIKITGLDSIKKTLDFVEGIRSAVRDEVHKLRAEEIKMMACVVYDMYHSIGKDIINADEATRVPLLVAVNKIIENVDTNAHEEYAICFSSYRGATYAIPYFFHAPVLEVLLNHPKVTPFPYWDTADKEEGLTDLQWKKRAEVWESILKASGVPAESMLTIKLIDSSYLVPDDKFMEDVPTVHQRELQLSRIIAFQRAEAELTEEGIDFGGGGRIRTLVERVSKIHPEVIDVITGTLEPITMDDLGEEIPQPKEEKQQGEESGEEEISGISSTD